MASAASPNTGIRPLTAQTMLAFTHLTTETDVCTELTIDFTVFSCSSQSPSSTGGVMNGSPLYRAHARLASPVLQSPSSPCEPKTEPKPEPFTELTVESSITPEIEPVCDITSDLSATQTSTQVHSHVCLCESSSVFIMWIGKTVASYLCGNCEATHFHFLQCRWTLGKNKML